MTDVSDESSITADWLETILQLYYNSKGREVLDGPRDDDNEDGEEDQQAGPKDTSSVVRVRKFSVRPGCEEGENLLSDLLAIDVQLERQGEAGQEELHLMAKLLSQDPFCRHFILEAGFDVREIHFYTTLMPALKDFCAASDKEWPVPHCYYAKYRQVCPWGKTTELFLDRPDHSQFNSDHLRAATPSWSWTT